MTLLGPLAVISLLQITALMAGENVVPEADPAQWPATGLPLGWRGVAKVENKNLVLKDGESLSKGVKLDAGKRYELTVEAHVDCDDGISLGANVRTDFFQVSIESGSKHWMRMIASQSRPGKYEVLSVTPDAPLDDITLSIILTGKGRAWIRKISLHPIQNPHTKSFPSN